MRIYRVAKVQEATRKPFLLMAGEAEASIPLAIISTHETRAEAIHTACLLAGWRDRVEWVDWRGRAYVISEGRP